MNTFYKVKIVNYINSSFYNIAYEVCTRRNYPFLLVLGFAAYYTDWGTNVKDNNYFGFGSKFQSAKESTDFFIDWVFEWYQDSYSYPLNLDPVGSAKKFKELYCELHSGCEETKMMIDRVIQNIKDMVSVYPELGRYMKNDDKKTNLLICAFIGGFLGYYLIYHNK